MKFNRIIYALAFTIAASLPLFGMMKKTARLALPKAFLPQSLPKLVDFSQAEAPFYPTTSTFPQYDFSGKADWYENTRWYQNVRWNKLKRWGKSGLAALLGLDFALFIKDLESAVNAQNALDRGAEALKMSNNAADIDPELYKVFLKIKNDYGIAEDVSLRIIIPFTEFVETCSHNDISTLYRLVRLYYLNVYFAKYLSTTKTILLPSKYKKFSKSHLIQLLAHELEHHRQINKYPGSYPIDVDEYLLSDAKTRTKLSARMETGADAAAADYLYCSKCLDEVARISAVMHPPAKSLARYFIPSQGYFSKEDYKIYQERAKEANALCCAHRSQTDKDPATPLKDFLPPIVK